MAKMPHRKHIIETRVIDNIRFQIVSNWPGTQYWMSATILDANGESIGMRAADEKCTKSPEVLERWKQELADAEKREDVPMPAITYFASQRRGSAGSAWNKS